MTAIDDLLRKNEAYARGFDQAGLPAPPSRRLAVVACMDARLDVYRILGLEPGAAHVIRNAGGVVTEDVLRSLLLSQRLLGTLEIALVQHTGCGLLRLREEEVKAEIEAETGRRPVFALEAFDDLAASVRRSIARLRDDPLLPHTDLVRGFVYDVETGRLEEVRP
jgi:carbonic anhydrase